jgi:hypothetical protein
MTRAQQIRQLVLDSQYVIDEDVVAAAMLARGAARSLGCEAAFLDESRPFRPCNLRPAGDVRALRARRRRGREDGR